MSLGLKRPLQAALAPRRVAFTPSDVGPAPSWQAVLAQNLETLRVEERLSEGAARADLGVLCLPQRDVAAAVAGLKARGVRALVAIGRAASGGPASAADRTALHQAAAKAGIRCLGPSRLGVTAPRIGLYASAFSRRPTPGHLALVTESDSLAATMIDWADHRGIGFSATLSLGESDQASVGDVLDELAVDPSTRAVLLHVERLTDARRFLSAGRALGRAKPVIVLKTGWARDDAVASGLPGGAPLSLDASFAGAFERAGFVRVRTIEEMFDAAELLAAERAARFRRAAKTPLRIVSNGAVPARIAADLLTEHPATPPTEEIVDLGADTSGADYLAALADRAGARAGCALAIHAPTLGVGRNAAEVAEALAAGIGSRPVVTAWLGAAGFARAYETLHAVGAPCYASVNDAVAGLTTLAAYDRAQDALAEIPETAAPHPGPAFDALRRHLDATVGAPAAPLDATGAALLRAALDEECAEQTESAPTESGPGAGSAAELDGHTARFQLSYRPTPVFGPVIALSRDGDPRPARTALPPLNDALAHHLLGPFGDEIAENAALRGVLVALSDLVTREPRLTEVLAGDLTIALEGASWRLGPVSGSAAALDAADPARRFAIHPYPTELIDRLTLRDGREVVVRPIRPEDARALQRGFEEMTPADRRMRLFSSVKQLSDAMASRFTQIDYDREMCFVVENPDDPGEIWGGARIAGDADGIQAEFSVSLRSDLKGLGLGRLALSHVLEYGRRVGYRLIWGSILRENAPMLGLAQKLGFSLEPDPDDPDIVKALLPIPENVR